MSVYQKNFIPISYNISILFKSEDFLEKDVIKVVEMIKEENVSHISNKIYFSSKLTYHELIEKYQNIFSLTKNENSRYRNFRLKFEDPKDSVYLFTNIFSTTNIDEFLEALKTFLNEQLEDLPNEIKKNISEKKIDFISATLLRDHKLIILFEKEVYEKICYMYINSLTDWKSFDELKKKMYEKSFVNSFIFWFEYKSQEHLFCEFQKICTNCKTVHNKDIQCNKVCVDCALITDKFHKCTKQITFCYVCKIYLNYEKKHKPLSTQCDHLYNLTTNLYMKTRRTVIVNILNSLKINSENFLKVEETNSENFLKVDENKHYGINQNDFPDLYDKEYKKKQSDKTDEELETESLTRMLNMSLENNTKEPIFNLTPRRMFVTVEIIEGSGLIINWRQNENICIQNIIN